MRKKLFTEGSYNIEYFISYKYVEGCYLDEDCEGFKVLCSIPKEVANSFLKRLGFYEGTHRYMNKGCTLLWNDSFCSSRTVWIHKHDDYWYLLEYTPTSEMLTDPLWPIFMQKANDQRMRIFKERI